MMLDLKGNMTTKEKRKSVLRYVLDTNVLLSDANAINSFQEHDVIIPLIVLEELDRHKDRQDDVGREAREIARRLRDMLKDWKHGTKGTKKGIPLANGGNLYLMSVLEATERNADGEPTTNVNVPEELNEKSGDNIILKFCRLLQEKSGNVILVTRDTLLLVKAKAIGLACEGYRKAQVARDVSSIYSGAIEHDSSDCDISAAYKEEVLADDWKDANGDKISLMPNEFVCLKNTATNQSALMRYVGANKPLKLIKKNTVGKLSSKNKEQTYALELLMDPDVKLVTLVGLAGSGKTLLAIAAGLEQTMETKAYKSLVISRPVQPMGKDIGFLPGTLEEKMEPWLAPIKDNLRFLLSQDGRKTKSGEDTLQMLFDRGIIEVEALTYIRGRSIANAYMIIDEAQNLSAAELKTIVTRVGEGTKIVLTGDIEQIDNLSVDATSNGLAVAVEKFKSSYMTGHVTLVKGERSALATLAANVL